MDLEIFIKIVSPYTMTGVERMTELYNSLEYIRTNNIEGDIVECGVWMGGNILGCIEYCKFYNMNRVIWLYDTFTGMTESGEDDIDMFGNMGKEWEGKSNISLYDVKKIIGNAKYPSEKIKYVVGDVLETLDDKINIPTKISILRLDTDWYSSTKKEMEVLYPKLNKHGVLIVDDYGHWTGSKKAIDEYFQHEQILIEHIDYTGIKIIKK